MFSRRISKFFSAPAPVAAALGRFAQSYPSLILHPVIFGNKSTLTASLRNRDHLTPLHRRGKTNNETANQKHLLHQGIIDSTRHAPHTSKLLARLNGEAIGAI
jgi:hypothetical protein